MSEWPATPLGDIIDLFDYMRVPLSSSQRAIRQGPFPYYGAQGIIDHIDDFIFDGRFILIPEDGENLRSRKLPIAFFADGRFWVNNHAHIARARAGVANDRFVQAAIQAANIQPFVTGAAQPKLSQANLRQIPIGLPPVHQQNVIASILDSLDDMIENSRRRIALLEQMAQAIYQEWFVRLRYPGHDDAILVDSPLGAIPEGWEVRQVLAIAGSARNAVTGGPFGSKLGRKDYLDAGVPVLRGANLRVGGGFDETDLVFVSEEKAAELRGSLATRGDIIVTQRGTLGQVGLIPARSRFGRYLLSQSQMKITVDGVQATAEFIYAQFRTPETAGRFIAQAMSSGVPHVNLALLREFGILVPPLAIQAAFTEVLAPLSSQELHLSEQCRVLISIRNLLLPKLVTGQIDVSHLDLDAVMDSVA